MVSIFKVPDWSTTTNMVVIDGVKSSVTVPEAWFGVSVTSDTSTPPGRALGACDGVSVIYVAGCGCVVRVEVRRAVLVHDARWCR